MVFVSHDQDFRFTVATGIWRAIGTAHRLGSVDIRSKLFVPASRPDWFVKAVDTGADAICIDLEDSVTDDRKREARRNVAEFLLSQVARDCGKIIVVRCNAAGTEECALDIEAASHPAVDLLQIPKTESPYEVGIVADALSRAESANDVGSQIGLLASIETPKGLRRAAKIAAASSRVVGLQLGLYDLFEPHGIDRHDSANVHAAQFALRMAASEAGVFAVDSASADIEGDEGLRSESEMARRLGYCGKSCIHPKQVAVVNEVFMRDDEEFATAAKILEACRKARLGGAGAFSLDGKMIDRPTVERAESLIALREASKNSK